ncbi:MAG: hypothetical protein ABJL44_13335 [Algibacter sp.]
MKNTNNNFILQLVALLFLIIIGYLTFNSSENRKIITLELDKAKAELKILKDTIITTKSQLENSKKEFEQMKAQKDLIIHKRDSLVLVFKIKNVKDLMNLQGIKDSIELINDRLVKDRFVLDNLFGLYQ